MPRALVSVAEKRGLKELVTALAAAGYEIVSSAGTARAIEEMGIACIAVSDLTGFPEIMDGRVKTLHPKIHGAILARRDQDQQILQQHAIVAIDLVVVNLYPFARTLEQHPDNHALLVENIDIGGPALLRAAAKNHRWVCSVVDPDDYQQIIDSLPDGPQAAMRERFAAKTFAYTSHYDAVVAAYLGTRQPSTGQAQPQGLVAPYSRPLRYGENPHQQGVLYHFDTASGWGAVQQHQGKELSYNNIADGDACWRCVSEFDAPACVIVKHANPCGVARADTLVDAYQLAFAADSESAFGGVIAVNGECDGSLAATIVATQFAEVIIAPGYSEHALRVFAAKPNLRVVSLPNAMPNGALRSVSGGVLWQSDAQKGLDKEHLRQVVAGRSELPLEALTFAWLVVKHVRSNAIVVASGCRTIGVGVGQTSRVRALRQALAQACDNGFATKGSVIASDAFFPFADSIDIAAEYQVGWIIQPGGSMRDQEVVQAAKNHRIGMVFTGERQFYH